jgi:hypothetical protein
MCSFTSSRQTQFFTLPISLPFASLSWGSNPIFFFENFTFGSTPVSLYQKSGTVVSICAESQYLEFSMAASVQGWRKKWFYIKDQKVSSFDQYGIAPLDASKEVKKLASWDLPPTEAEMEVIKPLLARIQALKSGRGGALSGTQLMAFFLQRQVQPLQHRLSKLWSFSGLGDSSRVSDDLLEKKDLDKRVRALTTLTKDHPLPVVCLLASFIRLLLLYHCFSYNCWLVFLPGSPVPCFSPSSSRGRSHSGCAYFHCLRSPRG